MTNKEAKAILIDYPCVCKYGSTPNDCHCDYCDFGEAVRTLVNEMGKWERVTNGACDYRYKCSVCSWDKTSRKYKYCPNCGTAMIEADGRRHKKGDK